MVDFTRDGGDEIDAFLLPQAITSTILSELNKLRGHDTK